MTKRLVELGHVFDAKGRSVMSYDQQERRIALLERQLARLLRILRHRQATETVDEIAKPALH